MAMMVNSTALLDIARGHGIELGRGIDLSMRTGLNIAATNKADSQSMPSKNTTAAAESKIRDMDIDPSMMETYSPRHNVSSKLAVQASAPVERNKLNMLV